MRVGFSIVAPDPAGDSAAEIAARLVNLGGHLTSWQPETTVSPAKAYFNFATEEARDWFITLALGVPGVSLETRSARTNYPAAKEPLGSRGEPVLKH